MDDFFREIKSALDIFKNDMIRFRVKPEGECVTTAIVREPQIVLTHLNNV